MDDFGLLVGRHLTSLPTLSDEQLSELQLDASGRLIIAGRFLEDSAHSSGDPGIHMLAVRRDADTTMVDTDGDYAPLQVDASGRLKVATVVSVEASDAEFAEDSAHTTGDTGLHMLLVRQDTLAASTNADGDYGSFKSNAAGELYVVDSGANALLTTIDADTSAIAVDVAAIEAELLDQGLSLDTIAGDTTSIDATLTALSKAEDSAHGSGDQGFQILGVRADSDGSLVDADGDYAPFQVDAAGNLKVVLKDSSVTLDPPGAENYAVTDALAAAGDGLATITAAATPWVSLATISVPSGTTAYVYGWQFACDQNCQARLMTDDTSDEIVYKTDVNSSAQPGVREHFANDGRIEIVGAANLELRIEMKKRSSTGGDANGTGSMHVRLVT